MRRPKIREEQATLITHLEPKSIVAEAYRSLRTNIEFASVDRPVKTIMTTSSGPGEGKTTVTANLAVTMAQSGKSTLVINADLRRPSVEKLFKVGRAKGLTTCLTGHSRLDEVITQTEIPNLSILPSGPIPPNPAELLGSVGMWELVQSLYDKYDYLLIDAPPIGAVTDAAVLAPKMDGVILVLHSGMVDRGAALRSKETLVRAKARILGTVLNNVPVGRGYGYNYDYYYYTSQATEA